MFESLSASPGETSNTRSNAETLSPLHRDMEGTVHGGITILILKKKMHIFLVKVVNRSMYMCKRYVILPKMLISCVKLDHA